MNIYQWSKKKTGYFFIGSYIIAIIVGVFVYEVFQTRLDNILMLTFVANLAMTVVIYLFSLLTKNASMYDPYWSVIPPLILIWWLIDLSLAVNITTVLLITAMSIWSIRLTYNWWKNWTGFKEQDWRYDLIQEKTKGYYFLSNFIAIHLIPTLVVYIQMINVFHIIQSPSSLNVLVIVGFSFMVFAAGIQYVADKQMFEFRQTRKNHDEIIDRGVWRYSRHPNYLGELSLWIGVYLIYLAGVRTFDFNIVYPLLMIALFLFVSIPMMEKKLKDRPGYQDYQNEVPMLFPYRKLK